MTPETLYYFSKHWLKRKVAQVLVTESLNLKDHDPGYLKMSQYFLATELSETEGAKPDQIKAFWHKNSQKETDRFRKHIMDGIRKYLEDHLKTDLTFEQRTNLENKLNPMFDDENQFHLIPSISRELTIEILRNQEVK